MFRRILLSVMVAAFYVGRAATSPSIMVLPRGCQYGRIASRRAACQPYAEAKSKSAYDVAGWHSFGRQLTAGIYGAAIGIDHQTRRKGARGVMSQHISINVVR